MFKKRYRIALEGGETTPINSMKRYGDPFTKGDKLFLCPICKIVWEHVAETGHVKHHDEWYPILPRYGKPEKTCPKCQNE